MLVLLLLLAHYFHADYQPVLDTYGASIGTNTAYCSIELVHGQLQASCQQGQ